MHARAHMRTLLVLAAAAIALGAAGTGLLRRDDDRPVEASGREVVLYEPDATTLSDCARGEIACLRQAYGNVSYRQGLPAATTLLEQATRQDAEFASICHTIAHDVGAAAAVRADGDVGAALGDSSSVCANGITHGLVSYAFLGAADTALPQRVRQICASMRREGRESLCGHPLGHGLMLSLNNEVPRALELCAVLEGGVNANCQDGVFMANVESQPPSRWLRKDDPTYPCEVVDARYRGTCYTQVPTRAAATGSDYAQIARLCDGAGDAAIGCHTGLGRRIAGDHARSPQLVLRACAGAAPRSRKVCVAQAAGMLVGIHLDARLASQTCAAAAESDRRACYAVVGNVLQSVLQPAQAAAQCRRYAADHLADCTRAPGAPGSPSLT